ncbi:transcription antitermination factor NusB [Ideonella sp. 4Y11]|uniref:Transcription antitermination protein NusB n=1 Tax=Ideonella aquatica TaxID=2824119 RepID=A0A940YNZ4_9BURK|nr:transcription antitermination factor NusB [Ideonella aquatica]MBQ0961369.1 transcription antitermination factor NusB [Ideonella aquatica]
MSGKKTGARAPRDPGHQQHIAARRQARAYALQGLYRWLLNGQDPSTLLPEVREFALQSIIERLSTQGSTELSTADEPSVEDVQAQIRRQAEVEFETCDAVHLDALLSGCIETAPQLDETLRRYVDRPTEQLSPVEHAALLIGAYELAHCVDVPYRVAINEAVNLAKAFGGTDGHKYVNGVLDKAAAQLRPAEVAAARGG